MKKIVVLSGAGISAESNIKTFRDSGGLWEGYDISEVATPEGWAKNPELVLEFYNQRRKQALDAMPNAAHYGLVQLAKEHEVFIITQNVDNLHEKAGSRNVIHLHGELFKSRSTKDENLVYDIKDWQLNWGDKCELGSQLRPHIVWFGEMVPKMEEAVKIAQKADVFIVIGTSLVVYPAAGLVDYVSQKAQLFVIDPNLPLIPPRPNLHLIEKVASEGVKDILRIFNMTE